VDSADVLVDGFGRIREVVRGVLADLTQQDLAFQVDAGSNSIAWLVWHLTRVQDDHVADAAGVEQVWTAQDWVDRFALPLDRLDTGFGHRSADVEAVGTASGDLLLGYHEAVHEQTVAYLRGLADADLDRVVDTAWDPPVTLGVRLVSVLGDDLQHAGQAAFVRGVARRR
jgi:uncharacterized damage-inducible protein DinB